MFIQKEDQTFLMVRTFIHIAVFNLLVAIVLYAPGINPLKLSDAQRVTNSFIYYNIYKIYWLPIIAVVVGFITIIGSHSIVGPVMRFKEVLCFALDRDLTPKIHLRKGDYFTEFAELLQEELTFLSEDVRHFRSKSQEALKQLESMGEVKGKEELKRTIEEIHSVAAAYKTVEREEPESGTAGKA